MKRARLLLALTLMALPVLAAAQLGNNGTIKAKVPFAFTLANKQLPAGEWTVVRNPLNETLAIRNARAKVGMFSAASRTESKIPASNYALVFHEYGNQHFLVGIKLAGQRMAYRLPESRAEAELRAQNAPANETILLASLN